MRYFFMELRNPRNVWILHKVLVAKDYRDILDVQLFGILASRDDVRYRPIEAIVAETTLPHDITVPVVIIGDTVQTLSYRQYLDNYIIQSDDDF